MSVLSTLSPHVSEGAGDRISLSYLSGAFVPILSRKYSSHGWVIRGATSSE